MMGISQYNSSSIRVDSYTLHGMINWMFYKSNHNNLLAINIFYKS